MCCCVVLLCVQIAGEKEYYLATAFEELYIAPTANVRLAGFSVAGEQQAGAQACREVALACTP